MFFPWESAKIRKRLAHEESRMDAVERRLRLYEDEQRAMINRISWIAGKGDDLMTAFDDIKAKLVALDDVVKAAESALGRLKEAADYLRSHGHDEAAAKEVADKLDAMKDELAAKVAEVGASGGV
jgi:chromosome segregation ATPase